MTARSLTVSPARALRPVVDGFAGLGTHATFYGRVVRHLPTAVVRYWRHVLRHVGDISFGSASLLAGGGTIGVVFAMSAVASTQIGLEGHRGLELIGLSPMTGLLSALVNTREIAPVVASIALAAKVGTGFTAQLGAMRISDEIDALETMAVPSLPFLVSTRMAAAFLSVIPLYLVGLVASYAATSLAVVHLKGLSAGTYDYWFHLLLTPSDVLFSLLKAIVFALVITLVHCAYGYYATGGPEGVGKAAGRALRTSIVAVTVLDVLLTIAFWGLRPTLPGLGA
ncbi:phospholipid/cholesterol/gamma-HCH transport system permease protein [Prauserella shujinwangii]|uniref:Phospholipid/cholesterol/gamma-HCH transport system permease protein n=1 Tax=Prauserella shujinwangii TaxID=1453103 RepID=A0A2T0LQ15_9PSEU|nr:ABC transporter permease [Prauserella shujinwangii]PRX45419.1 phospholipid/cholesterol/gamma-HCH transport system permease protein [Prauserella shujinwangii]